MRALGFNVVRLALSWSLLEPQPGQYSTEYVDRIAQVVGWARDQGIYVILDMHENAYSRYIPRPAKVSLPGGRLPSLVDQTGAPKWATITDGLPGDKFRNQREMSLSVGAAFTNFWLNAKVAGEGLQDHYLGAVATLARRFKDESAVVGFGAFNEPWPGFVAPPASDDLLIYPFYRRLIDGITGVADGARCPSSFPALPICGHPSLGVDDRRHIFFLEADHLREVTDFPTAFGLPVSSYPNLAFSIHPYTHKYTLDALAGQDPKTSRLSLRRLRPGLWHRRSGGSLDGRGALRQRVRQRAAARRPAADQRAQRAGQAPDRLDLLALEGELRRQHLGHLRRPARQHRHPCAHQKPAGRSRPAPSPRTAASASRRSGCSPGRPCWRRSGPA